MAQGGKTMERFQTILKDVHMFSKLDDFLKVDLASTYYNYHLNSKWMVHASNRL